MCHSHHYLAEGRVYSDVVDAEVFHSKRAEIGTEQTLPALRQCGFSEEGITEIIHIVLGVLMLGNVRFDPASTRRAVIENEDVLMEVAELWKVKPARLRIALTHSTVANGVQAELSLNEGYLHRDSLAKNVYHDLFAAIVKQCSDTLSQGVKKEVPCSARLSVVRRGIHTYKCLSFRTHSWGCSTFSASSSCQKTS